MTNEQLAILLDNYATMLDDAIDEVEAALPSDVERAMTWHYKGGNPFAIMQSSPEADPKLWEQMPGEALCLTSLQDLSSRMLQHVNILRGIHGED